jgi:hypothetical protein
MHLWSEWTGGLNAGSGEGSNYIPLWPLDDFSLFHARFVGYTSCVNHGQ